MHYDMDFVLIDTAEVWREDAGGVKRHPLWCFAAPKSGCRAVMRFYWVTNHRFPGVRNQMKCETKAIVAPFPNHLRRPVFRLR